jgi:hypothetical protein
MPDADGYPTPEELKFFDRWKWLAEGVSEKEINAMLKDGWQEEIIAHLEKIWWHPEQFKRDGRKLALHTCGWSGNEDIINTLRDTIFWGLYWEKSTRGGHYYFVLPKKGRKL